MPRSLTHPGLFFHALAAVLGASASLAGAQVMTVTSQERYIEGQTHSTFPGGSTSTAGPLRVDAIPDDFGTWMGDLTVGGNVTVTGSQGGGWDGANAITLTSYSMSLGGGGPPDSAGESSLRNVFEMGFTVNQNATYTLNTSFACSLDVMLRLTITGTGVAIDATAIPNGPFVEFINHTGNLVPGSYVLRLDGDGTIAYEGGPMGGGNGGGAGGPQPLLSFVTAPRTCPADINNSGSVSVQDIFDFLAFYFANDSAADFNNSGSISVQDIFDFLGAYFTPCV